MLGRMLQKLKLVTNVSFLCDDDTDIAVMEQFVTFIQFVNPESTSLQTSFLFFSNAPENSESADAETLFTVLCYKLNQFGIKIDKLSSLASDRAAVMLGKKSGLTTRLNKLNPKILSIHCICHRLALACTDSDRDIEHIANVEDIL